MILQRVLIRKKKGANVLAEVYESRVITEERPTKMLLEIANSMYRHNILWKLCKIPFPLLHISISFSIYFLFHLLLHSLCLCACVFFSLSLVSSSVCSGGSIRLYTEKLKSQPIIATMEENPLPIQYISFAGFESSEVQFFYNCSHIDTSVKSVMG